MKKMLFQYLGIIVSKKKHCKRKNQGENICKNRMRMQKSQYIISRKFCFFTIFSTYHFYVIIIFFAIIYIYIM